MQNDQDNTFPLPNTPPASGSTNPAPVVPSNDWASTPTGNPTGTPSASGLPSAPAPAPTPPDPLPATPSVASPPEPLVAAPSEPTQPMAPGQVIADTEAHQMASPDYPGGTAPGLAQPTPLPDQNLPVSPPASDPNAVMPAASIPPTQAQPEPAPVPAGNTLDLSSQPAPEEPVANEFGITPAQPVLADVPQAGVPAGMPPGASVGGGLPTDLNGAMMDPNLMAATTPPPKRSIFKIVLLVVGILIALLIVVSLVVFITSRASRKPAIELNDNSSTQSTTSNTAQSQPATIPANFVKIDKDCYSFAAYKVNTIPADTACNFTATEGSVYNLAVTPVTDSYDTLDAFGNAVKANLTSPTVTTIQLDNLNAQKITYTKDGKTQVKYVVLTPNKPYKFNSKAVTGFTIDSAYSDANSQSNANTLVSTWRWK